MKGKSLILIILILVVNNISISSIAQNTIDISVKGISDSQNDGAQQDRLEAILDAKIQACEKAGLSIQATSIRENFQITYDFVETQAETVLLPGFQIIDIGYVQDGTYQVVLVGKIQATNSEEKYSYLIVFDLYGSYQYNEGHSYFADFFFEIGYRDKWLINGFNIGK